MSEENINKLYLLSLKELDDFFQIVYKNKNKAEKLHARLGLKAEWEIAYELKFLVRDKGQNILSCPTLDFLIERASDDRDDYKRLLGTIKLQLSQKRIPYNSERVSIGKPQSEIIEFKAMRGKSRLFAFRYMNKIIICTHGYMKSDSLVKQNEEFEKAERMRIRFLEQENDYE